MAIRVICGYNNTFDDSNGNRWANEYGQSGGSSFSTVTGISGTVDDTVYQHERYGTFSYTFDVPNGSYQIVLKFAEIFYSTAGARVFNVDINGSSVLTNFDIVSEAGAGNTALDKTFNTTVTGNQIVISTSAITSSPKISAIEITEISLSEPAYFRINCGAGPAFTDGSSNKWTVDCYGAGFTGNESTGSGIAGTTDDTLYQSAKSSNTSCSYLVAAPAGLYQVKLKFAEIFYGSAGNRDFDVAINGATVLSNYDQATDAGAVLTATDEVFTGISPSSGRISIVFTPNGGSFASINAIEVLQTNVGYDQSKSDSLSLSDAISYDYFGDAQLFDTLAFFDEAAILVINLKKKALERLVSVNDILSFADVLKTAAPYVTEVSDSNSISDNLIPTLARLSSFSDAISLSDDAFPLSSLFDGISLSDSAVYALDIVPPTNYDFSFSDTLAIGEAQTFIASPSFISLSDNLILSDKVTGYPQTNLKNYLRRYLNDVPTPIN